MKEQTAGGEPNNDGQERALEAIKQLESYQPSVQSMQAETQVSFHFYNGVFIT